MVSPQPEHGVEQPAVEHSLGQVVDQQQAAEIKGFPVMICYEDTIKEILIMADLDDFKKLKSQSRIKGYT